MAKTRTPARLTWDAGYLAATAYFAFHGNLDVPEDFVTGEGFPLGDWIENERFRHRYGRTTPRQEEYLDEIGMLWTKFDVRWERSFQAVCSYVQSHGKLCIPQNVRSKDGVDLNLWLSNQRQRYKAGKLSEDRLEKLNAIGMWWEPYENRWQEMLHAAEEYYKVHGHLRVPFLYKTAQGENLGVWIAYQRELTQAGNYPPEKKAQLDAIAMEWREDPWEKRFRLAKDYYEQHGHLNVPHNYVTDDGIWLGKWLYLQRKQKETLTAEQIARLNGIEMKWTPIKASKGNTKRTGSGV